MTSISNTKAVDLAMSLMEDGQKTRTRGPIADRLKEALTHEPDKRVAEFSLAYLDAFGYLKTELAQWQDITMDDLKNAMGAFQSMFGLKRTRTIDVQTIRAMEAPRCGCPDAVPEHHTEARALEKAVTANLARWKKSGLTYAIADYLPDIPQGEMDAAIQAAFDKWTQHADIAANRTNGTTKPDILISHGRGRQSNFDGPGGSLAWAEAPTADDAPIKMMFDTDEIWTLDSQKRGTNIHVVAGHEVGHLLGLSHSRVPSAYMAPYYNAFVAEPQPDDDIPRLQARYGVRQRPAAPAAVPVSDSIWLSPVRVSLKDAVAALEKAGYKVDGGRG